MTVVRLARTPLLAFALCWSIIASAQIPVPPLHARITDQTATQTERHVGTEVRGLLQVLEAGPSKDGSSIG